MNEKTRNVVTENQKLLKGRQAVGESTKGMPTRSTVAKSAAKPLQAIPDALMPILREADAMGKLRELFKALAAKPPLTPAERAMADFARTIF